MRISFDFLSSTIKISEDKITVLSIENKKLFRDVVSAFNFATTEENNIIFSENFMPFNYKGNIFFINDFYNLTCSNSIIKKLYEQVETFCNSELSSEVLDIKFNIANFMELISSNFDYDLIYDSNIDLVSLFKSQSLKPNINNENLLCSLIDFIIIINKYMPQKCFVLLNLHLYFTNDELTDLYKELLYNKVRILLIENNYNLKANELENLIIVDNDFCEIIDI